MLLNYFVDLIIDKKREEKKKTHFRLVVILKNPYDKKQRACHLIYNNGKNTQK